MEPRSGFEPETSSFAYTSFYIVLYKRARLYLEHILTDVAPLVSRSGLSLLNCHGLILLHRTLTVIRDSPINFLTSGRGRRPTMDALYQLSYRGVTISTIVAKTTSVAKPLR